MSTSTDMQLHLPKPTFISPRHGHCNLAKEVVSENRVSVGIECFRTYKDILDGTERTCYSYLTIKQKSYYYISDYESAYENSKVKYTAREALSGQFKDLPPKTN